MIFFFCSSSQELRATDGESLESINSGFAFTTSWGILLLWQVIAESSQHEYSWCFYHKFTSWTPQEISEFLSFLICYSMLQFNCVNNIATQFLLLTHEIEILEINREVNRYFLRSQIILWNFPGSSRNLLCFHNIFH